MPLLVEAQRSEEWFAARLGKVTASLAAAALHLHPYKSARSAWREITGCKTEAESRVGAPGTPPHFGVIFEAPARLAYEAHQGVWVDETGFWVSDDYPWLGSSADGLIGADTALEIKCPEYCSRTVKPHYRIQCLIHLIVLRRKVCQFVEYGWREGELWVAPPIYPLSQTGEAALVKRLYSWWQKHIEGGEEPQAKPRRKRRD